MEFKCRKIAESVGFKFCRTRINLNETRFVQQEFDESGNHRLVYDSTRYSEWASYGSFAILQVHGFGQFAGTSEYWSGTFPRVFQFITPLEV